MWREENIIFKHAYDCIIHLFYVKVQWTGKRGMVQYFADVGDEVTIVKTDGFHAHFFHNGHSV